jgi:hypothetical protein
MPGHLRSWIPARKQAHYRFKKFNTKPGRGIGQPGSGVRPGPGDRGPYRSSIRTVRYQSQGGPGPARRAAGRVGLDRYFVKLE